LAGRWLSQHIAPVRAKPDSRPCLEGCAIEMPDKLLTPT